MLSSVLVITTDAKVAAPSVLLILNLNLSASNIFLLPVGVYVASVDAPEIVIASPSEVIESPPV